MQVVCVAVGDHASVLEGVLNSWIVIGRPTVGCPCLVFGNEVVSMSIWYTRTMPSPPAETTPPLPPAARDAYVSPFVSAQAAPPPLSAPIPASKGPVVLIDDESPAELYLERVRDSSCYGGTRKLIRILSALPMAAAMLSVLVNGMSGPGGIGSMVLSLFGGGLGGALVWCLGNLIIDVADMLADQGSRRPPPPSGPP